MKVFSVFGITGSGKTSTIEGIIRELTKRRYSVGSVKEIHYEGFAIDREGTNTDRHRRAGSSLVTARGYAETDFLYPRRLSLEEILRHYQEQDFVVLEGIADGNFPKIITAHSLEEIDERLEPSVFAISGRIANKLQVYKGIPVINAMTNPEQLVDLIEAKVFPRLPDVPAECCKGCGLTCRELGVRILEGRAKISDCVLYNSRVKLYIDGREIKMVPFVQSILQNAVKGVVQELDGYEKNASITIRIEQ